MIQHLPDIPRPMTDIERFIREIEPKSPEVLPERVQVPGFRDPHDPRIPSAARLRALNQARRDTQQQKGRRK